MMWPPLWTRWTGDETARGCGTLLARFLVSRFTRPRPLMLQAWLWLAAEADDTEEKRRCLNAIVGLDPENEEALLALLALDRKRPES